MGDDGKVAGIERRLTTLENDVASLAVKMDRYAISNQEIASKIDSVQESVSELVELWKSLKGTGNVARWVGGLVKWASAIVVAVAAAWVALTKGLKP